MRDRPRGVAVAHHIDFRMISSGVKGSEGTVLYVPFFYLHKVI